MKAGFLCMTGIITHKLYIDTDQVGGSLPSVFDRCVEYDLFFCLATQQIGRAHV